MTVTELAAPAVARPPEAAGPGAPLAVRLVGVEGLAALEPAWADLARRAVEPNAFFAPPFAIAAITRFGDAAGTRCLTAWQGERLVGLLPVRLRRGPLRLAVALAHNYGPLSTPLLDRDDPVAAATALLAWLGGPGGARVLVLPTLTADGPAAQALAETARTLHLPSRRLQGFGRGLAIAADGSYALKALGKKKRHDLERQRRRLAEQGPVTLSVATASRDVAAAVEAFLALEAGGWKGRAGTATVQRADRAAFLREAVLGLAERGQARLYRLDCAGRPVAVGIALVDGARGWFWKIAYDEAYARVSPGVQLAVALTDGLLAEPGITSIDSVADPGHPMIDHLFRERLAVTDLLIGLEPRAHARLAVVAAIETARRRARALARRLLRRDARAKAAMPDPRRVP
jgi:CelD/BcsL family acetyltransferase involved in cellulose biosynthesis